MSGPFNKDELGEDTRSELAIHCREGVDPRSAIEDWGDYDEDHNSTTDEAGVTYSSPDDVEDYYTSANDRRDFRIL